MHVYFSHARVFQPCMCISLNHRYFSQARVFQPCTGIPPCTGITAMHRYSPMHRYFTHAQVFQQCTGISSIHVYFNRARVFHPCTCFSSVHEHSWAVKWLNVYMHIETNFMCNVKLSSEENKWAQFCLSYMLYKLPCNSSDEWFCF